MRGRDARLRRRARAARRRPDPPVPPVGADAGHERRRHRPRGVARRRRPDPSSSASACVATVRCPARVSSCSRSPRRSATRRLVPNDRITSVGPCVENARDAAPSPARARARPRLPGGRERREALGQDALQGRSSRAATCSTASGSSASTTKIRGSRSGSCAPRRRRAGRKTTVPNVWNLGDASNESMTGGIGWYRKDFELPDADSALAWALRFESVNYRTRVWINGRPIGENTGAYIPFEVRRERPQAPRDEPARGARRLAPARSRLPARPPERRQRADRRLVELLRHPARGLPAQDRHASTSSASRSARSSPAGRARRACAIQVNLRNVTRQGAARHGHGQVRRPDAQPGHEGHRPGRDRVVHGHGPDRASRGCGRRRPRTSTTSASPCARTAARSPATSCTAGSARSRSPTDGSSSTASSSICAASACTRRPRARASRSTTRAAISSSRRRRRSARRCCARTTRCIRTRTSWPTGSGC